MNELPRNWTWAALGELGRWEGGGTPSKAVPEYWTGDIPWVSAKDMKVERIRDAVDHISVEAVSGSATKVVPVGSVLVVTRSGILRHTLPVAVSDEAVAINQDLKALIPYPGIDGTYVAWALRANANRILSECAKAGTTVSNVETKKLLGFAIPIAPVAEQRRIVAAIEEQLSRIDAAMASAHAAISRLPHLYDKVLGQAIAGGWPRRPLGELLAEPLRNGLSARASATGTTRIITLSAVTRGTFTEANSKLADVDGLRARGLWLEPGDLLIERSNTPELVGTAALYTGETGWAIFPDLLIRVRVTDELRPEFLEVVLRTRYARRYFQAAAEGLSGSMPKIDQGDIKRLMVPLPSLDAQDGVVAEVSRLRSVIEALQSEVATTLRRAASLRQSILATAFRGELVPQDSEDEPASVALERVAFEHAAAKPTQTRRTETPA